MPDKPDRYVPPPRVWFLGLFGLKKCIDFAHLVWNRVWFSRELRERMNIFIVSDLNMKIRNAFEEFFCLGSNLRNDDAISA